MELVTHISYHNLQVQCSGWTPWCIYIWLDISAPSISRAWFFRTLGSQSFCFMNVPVKVIVSGLGELAVAILLGEGRSLHISDR